MPYRERRIKSGDILEVEIYPISLIERRQSRRKKRELTVPKQRNLNDKNAKKHFLRLLDTNFTKNDLFITLTYEYKNLPSTREEGKKEQRNFIRRARYYWKKKGIEGEFKYLAVLEHVDEDGEMVRMHHHIVMSGGIPRDDLEELWGKGRSNTKRLQPNERGLEELGEYLVKTSKKGERRWIGSKNLKKPIVEVNDWKYTKRKVGKIAGYGADDNVFFEKEYEGYAFLGCVPEVNKVTDAISLYIKMRTLRN